ncbi:MAG: hypothetical protein LM590_14925, partial [Thermofilum sp.]|nr:hypothetical protein [Thermofilum sp.]
GARGWSVMGLRVVATPHVEHYTVGLYGELASRASITLVTLRRYDVRISQQLESRLKLSTGGLL